MRESTGGEEAERERGEGNCPTWNNSHPEMATLAGSRWGFPTKQNLQDFSWLGFFHSIPRLLLMLRGLSVDTRCSLLMGRQWCQSSCRLGVKWGLVEEKGDTENSSSIMFSVDMEVAMQRQNMPAVTILSFSSLFLILDHGSYLILVMDPFLSWIMDQKNLSKLVSSNLKTKTWENSDTNWRNNMESQGETIHSFEINAKTG